MVTSDVKPPSSQNKLCGTVEKTLKTITSSEMNKRDIAYEPSDDIETHDLKKRNSTATLDQQKRELYDSQEAHLKALSLDMNELHSMGVAIECALDTQNEQLCSLSNQAIELSEQHKMVTRRAERLCQDKINW
eukprot:CAMPEP_0194412380 /NCGR_PEP_ID=MMETSP0176-20130528/10850_1 /TAXON_ID=216777 /ORGANISM="Proboscia alata, Strain PI-D3" /LENGTH=132 /DNA_ID=CAMNT_0039215107 /DNA_START=230 /DNA_END=625 /DNA_ORIENTATION=-